MKPTKVDIWLFAILILACFGLIWVLARVCVATRVQQLELSSLPTIKGEVAISPMNVQEPAVEGFLPPGAALVERSEADLNNDGRSELVLVFDAGAGTHEPRVAGIAALVREGGNYRKVWEARLSSGGQVTDVIIRDINMDGILEVLVFKSTEDEAEHSLHIFAWNGTGYASLIMDGEEAITSAYYPPELRNVDSTDLEEIVAFEDNPSSERLRAIIYRWDGVAYMRVDWITILGPPREPTAGD